jgi:hypothetical protein
MALRPEVSGRAGTSVLNRQGRVNAWRTMVTKMVTNLPAPPTVPAHVGVVCSPVSASPASDLGQRHQPIADRDGIRWTVELNGQSQSADAPVVPLAMSCRLRPIIQQYAAVNRVRNKKGPAIGRACRADRRARPAPGKSRSPDRFARSAIAARTHLRRLQRLRHAPAQLTFEALSNDDFANRRSPPRHSFR